MRRGKNVLFISYDGLTDPLGQSQVIPYLTGLTRYGYEFTIISCDKKENYKAHSAQVHTSLAKFPVRWISLPYHKSPPVLSSMLDLYRIKQTIRKLQVEDHFDCVHTRPGIPTLAALWMKKKYGTLFVNDIRGFWADERVDGNMWNLKNPLYKQVYRFFKMHEAECLEKADHNICLTHAAKKEILSWQNKNPQIKIDVIPCSADLSLFDPSKVVVERQYNLRQKLKIDPNDMVITYLGSIGGWYFVDEMMRFFKILSGIIPTAKFLFISPHRHEQIREAAMKESIPLEKIIIASAQRNEVPALLALSSFSIFFIRPCYSKISSSPTKHGEIMAMGIPVISNGGVGDVKEIVEKYKSGFIVPDFSDESFTNLVAEIKLSPGLCTQNIRAGAEEVYNLKNAIESYREVYDSLMKS